ncbi:permease [Rhabdaerophilum sp. SD176]|uniref:permease n=1 Tax=Rhabdaerophilum sp. SD176 TaxID=2983548 RepID=UPI0024E00C4C|nr:permease [Rhabdaerophilum sp. SD176]
MIIAFFTVLLFAIAVTLGGVAWRRGRPLFDKGLADARAQFLHLLPRLLIGILGSGFLAHLLPRETVLAWFGPNSGWTGTLLATIAGALTPGGPVVGYALGAAALKAGADFAQVIAYVTAWSLLTLNRMLTWEMPSMPMGLIAVRVIVSLPLPFLAAWLTMLVR